MSGSGYFRVVNIEKFQHYKERNPPWIKLHNTLLDNYEFGCLHDASKVHLVLIWLLASRHGNRLPWDSKWIAARIQATSKTIDLDAMLQAGFIERIPVEGRNTSTPLAEREHDASNLESTSSAQTEKRREETENKNTLSGNAKLVLDYLNEKAGKHFEPNDVNLGFITSRLQEGATTDQCKAVIDAKVREWKLDEERNQYLRPATLFNKTKFAQYKGALPRPRLTPPTPTAPRPREEPPTDPVTADDVREFKSQLKGAGSDSI